FMPEIHEGHYFPIFDRVESIRAYLYIDKEHPSTGENIFGWFIGTLIYVLIIIIAFIIIRLFRYRLLKRKIERNTPSLSYEKVINDHGEKGLIKRIFGKPPEHQVRKIIYRFEREAWKLKVGRHPYETLEEWLNRIDAPIDYGIYEKLRYGKKDVSKEEVDSLDHHLRAIVKRWKQSE